MFSSVFRFKKHPLFSSNSSPQATTLAFFFKEKSESTWLVIPPPPARSNFVFFNAKMCVPTSAFFSLVYRHFFFQFDYDDYKNKKRCDADMSCFLESIFFNFLSRTNVSVIIITAVNEIRF